MKDKILLLVCLALLLTSCQYIKQDYEEREYYKGIEGVNAEFTSNSPPSELFVRQESENTFTVDVEVVNRGASWTKGGVYLSGYNPRIIDFQEIEENQGVFDACQMSVESLNFGNFEGFVQCRRLDLSEIGLGKAKVGVSVSDAGFTVDVRELGLGDLFNDVFNTEFFTEAGFNESHFRITVGENGNRLDFGFDNPQLDPEQSARGPYMLSLWQPINFDQNQGRQFILKGDTPNYPGEKTELFTYHGKVKKLPKGRETAEQPIMLTTCYLYSTYAAPRVCIDRNPRSGEEKACRPTPYNGGRGQGGPVAITSVSQKSTGQEMVFDITIENLGRGTVYNPLRIQSCSPYYPLPATEQDVNTVLLGMAYIGDDMIECMPEKNKVRLYNGRGKVKCVYDMEEGAVSRSAYETPLVLEMWYGYSETERRTMKIQRI